MNGLFLLNNGSINAKVIILKTISNEAIQNVVKNNLKKGMYCAETTVIAITETQGIESKLLTKAATAFCSGMSGTCGTCGALTGGTMGLSALLGRDEPDGSVEPAYQATHQLITEFEQTFGSKNCHELLGCDLGTVEGQTRFMEDKLHQRCVTYISKSTEIANRILNTLNKTNNPE